MVANFDLAFVIVAEASKRSWRALIRVGVAGIASRTGQTGYAAEMNSILAAVLQP